MASSPSRASIRWPPTWRASPARIGRSSPQAALRYQHASARRDLAIAAGIDELIRHERGAIRPEARILGSR